MAVLLETSGLTAFYDDFQALFGIDVAIGTGEAIAIIGANGAGKSTFLRTVCGLLPGEPNVVRHHGEAIGGMPAHRIVARGIAMVPEGRRLFPSLSVEENLRLGGDVGRKGPWSLDRVYHLFPILAERRRLSPASLSGGQQQMAAIGRALLANPRLLICDELSLGLAPLVIQEIYAALREITGQGTTAILVEQDVELARRASQRLYCLQEGRVSLTGRSSETPLEAISRAYFGV
jgi:branched-chain amino acid transport system ATP-binding protein